jgi:hypothetical protein
MSAADQHPDSRRAARYRLIVLDSMPGKPLSPEVVNRHAAHPAERGTWPMSDRQIDDRRNIEPELQP